MLNADVHPYTVHTHLVKRSVALGSRKYIIWFIAVKRLKTKKERMDEKIKKKMSVCATLKSDRGFYGNNLFENVMCLQ